MKKVLIAVTAVVAGFVVFSASIKQGHTNQAAAPAGNTGSPGDNNQTCARSGCHNGSATPTANLITSNIPETGYVPGATYTITATIAQDGKVKFGFQVSPQNDAGTKLGTLIVTNSTATTLIGAGKYITHKTAGTGGQGSRTWTFDWTAPASGSGPVTFYGSFNVTNNNGSDSGDQIFTSSLTVQEGTLGVDDMQADKAELIVFPNPSNGKFSVAVSGVKAPISAKVFTADGRLVYSHLYNNVGTGKQIVDVNADGKLSTGIYFVAVESDGLVKTVKLVIQ